jgi:hypothetical protein
MASMASDAYIQCRVPAATKQALRAAAGRQQLSESALLKRMVDLMLHTAAGDAATSVTDRRPGRSARLYVRLSPGDWALLRERASARCLAPATYASNLIRAHLRAQPPLPKEELQALRQSVAQLRAIGSNLNQLAHAANSSGHTNAPGRESLRALLKVCEGMRDHVRSLIQTNTQSWQSGDAP